MTVAAALAPAIEPSTPAERRMHDALRETDPAVLEGFLRNLGPARRTTLRRFLAALWREDVTGLRTAGHRLGGWVAHELDSGTTVTFPVQAERAFDRIEAGEPVLRLDGGPVGDLAVVSSPAELAGLLKLRDPALAWDVLADELDDSVANLALAYARAGVDGGPPGPDDHLLHFERRNTAGHNLHPCARTRLGMDVANILRYDLEAAAATELVLVGIRRDRAESTPDDTGADIGEVLRASYPSLDQAIREQVPDPDDYVFLPVHPWQLEARVRHLFSREIADGTVVVVPAARLPAAPTTSLRTLLTQPSDSGRRLFVKTAMDVQITSTRRTISAHTTNNGPLYSRLLRDVVAREPSLAERVVPLAELAGASYRSAEEHRARTLSALIREVPQLQSGELPVPGCALIARSPYDGRSLLREFLEASTAGRTGVLDWLEGYASLLLSAAVTLMTKYGIGLEAHLQNCVPTFVGGRPHRLLLRDWGGIRIYPPRLERHGLTVERRPGARTVTDDLGMVRVRALSTTMANHLDEIVGHLVADLGVDESAAWRRIGTTIDRLLNGLAQDPALRGDATADREVLFGRYLPVKALVTMRLRPDGGEQFVDAASPLRTSN